MFSKSCLRQSLSAPPVPSPPTHRCSSCLSGGVVLESRSRGTLGQGISFYPVGNLAEGLVLLDSWELANIDKVLCLGYTLPASPLDSGLLHRKAYPRVDPLHLRRFSHLIGKTPGRKHQSPCRSVIVSLQTNFRVHGHTRKVIKESLYSGQSWLHK